MGYQKWPLAPYEFLMCKSAHDIIRYLEVPRSYFRVLNDRQILVDIPPFTPFIMCIDFQEIEYQHLQPSTPEIIKEIYHISFQLNLLGLDFLKVPTIYGSMRKNPQIILECLKEAKRQIKTPEEIAGQFFYWLGI